MRKESWLAVVVAIWLVAIGASLVMLWKYKSTPGSTGAQSGGAHVVDWPTASQLTRGPHSTLVMFAHPYCPCTRASMNQLAEIMSKASISGQTRAIVVFAEIDGDESAESALFKRAHSIVGVRAVVDHGGREALAFGAATSGHVMLYDAGGRRLFSGGITGARGHEGDNPGTDRVLGWIENGYADSASAPIFGCSLKDD